MVPDLFELMIRIILLDQGDHFNDAEADQDDWEQKADESPKITPVLWASVYKQGDTATKAIATQENIWELHFLPF